MPAALYHNLNFLICRKTTETYYVTGEQWLIDEAEGLKTHEIQRNRVDTFMVVFRIFEVHLDIVVSITVPVPNDFPHTLWNAEKIYEKPTKSEKAISNLKQVLSTFEIIDWQRLF